MTIWTIMGGFISSLMALTTLADLAGGAESKEVVVYTSVDDVFARPIAEEFTKQTGILVKLVTDTEETKSTGLINRLVLEKQRAKADVFWSGDPVRAAALKRHGVSAPYDSPAAAGLPRQFSDKDRHWIGFSARTRVIIYNKKKLPKGKAPRSLADFAKPEYRGMGCLANPLFGTTSMHVAAVFEQLGPKKAEKLFDRIAANEIKILSSNGEVRRRVASGDFAFGLTDTDDAMQAIRDGRPVGVIFHDQKSSGTLVVPNATVLIRGAPHERNAKRFVDFLLSESTERALARSDAAQIPLRSHLAGPKNLPQLDQIKVAVVDYGRVASRLEAISKGFLRKWVAQNTK